MIRTLEELREAPAGRRKLVVSRAGPALQWDEGLTGLDGQGLLPLDDQASLDDLTRPPRRLNFPAISMLRRGSTNLPRARTKRIRLRHTILGLRIWPAAVRAMRRLLSSGDRARPDICRGPLQSGCSRRILGKDDVAHDELVEALKIDASYADARFNLAQLNLKRGAFRGEGAFRALSRI